MTIRSHAPLSSAPAPLASLLGIEPDEIYWGITPEGYNAFLAAVEAAAGTQAVKIEIERTKPNLTLDGDEAVIPIDGVLLQSVPAWVRFFGIAATGYDELLEQLTAAEADPRVKSIRLAVDSPGGQVAGEFAVAEAIAATTKPIRAVVDFMAASAAYWLASQADEIVATDPNGMIGSIGVFAVYYDLSARFEREGFKTVLIRSGEHKGMGVMGAPITDEQIAAVQQEIDGIAEHFIEAVAAGRNLPIDDVRELATGRTWLAPRALEKKLIDAVRVATSQPSESAAAEAHETKGEAIMATEQEEKQAVDLEQVEADARSSGALAERDKLAEFKGAFPDDLEFAVGAYESGVTLAQAQGQHALLTKRIEAAEAKKPAGAAGADAAIGAGETEGNAAVDAEPDFLTVSRAYAKEHDCSMSQAMQAVQRRDPASHKRFCADAEQRARPVEGVVERIAG